MSSASNVASGVIWSGSAPNVASDSTTTFSTCSVVTAVLITVPFVCSGGQSAVDVQGGAGHVAGRIGGEEARACGDLLGRAGPARGNGLQELAVPVPGQC